MNLTLTELELMNFRNYLLRHFLFKERHVLFSGRNGVGKSNILEAIFYLSILRSFRASTVKDMVNIGEKSFVLRGIINKENYSESLEIEQKLSGLRQLFIDGSVIRRSSEFIQEFRAVTFAPEDMQITVGSGFFRRRFFDMFIGVMEPAYFNALRRYSIAVTQRNMAIRNSLKREVIAAFEPEIATMGSVIANYRTQYSVSICEEINTLFLGKNSFEIDYKRDYSTNVDEYLTRLKQEQFGDRRKNFTSFGPQLDDFIFKLDGKILRNFGSNGQNRLVALFLKMAEFKLIKAKFKGGVIALVDDVTGELDNYNKDRFFALLKDANQIFSTFTEIPKLTDNPQIIEL